MKKLAAMFVVCGVCSMASAWNLWTGTSVLARTIAAERADGETEDALAAIPCLGAFSKDGCDGVVEPLSYDVVGCPDFPCRTIVVKEAVYTTSLKTSGLGCGLICESACDEFPDARLKMVMAYVLRADSCCPYRGSWEGKWELTTVDGVVYTGSAHGTLGVGTNRKSQCPVVDDACENCYDVQLTPDAWFVGFEGSFRGTRVSADLPADELNFTMDGTWIAAPDADQPFRLPARVSNRFDGVSITYCR